MYSILFYTKKTVELWSFVTIKACHYGLKTRILLFLDLGVGNLNPVLWQPDTSQHHKIRLRINPKPYCDILKQRINERCDRIFERNWNDKFSSFLWFSTLEKYHAYLNHYCEPVPHHISILFVLDNAEGIETHCRYWF